MGVDVGNGRLIPTTPWEGMWHGVCQWLGVEDGDIMSGVMPNLGNFGDDMIYGKSEMFE